MERLVFKPICEDLKKKMVFIGGPRQCGKTHLTKSLLKHFKSSDNYFNWESTDDKKIILNKAWSAEKIIGLDEIHKYPKWKNFVKGI